MIASLTREDYLARVRERAGEAAEGLGRFWPTLEQQVPLRERLEAFGMPTDAYPGLVHAYDLSQAKALFHAPPHPLLNWHYDRTAQTVLVNLRRGTHESLSAALLHAYWPALATGDPGKDAEIFLSEGLGWFLSTSSFGRVLKAPGVSLNAQEQQAFSQLRFF